MAKSKTRPRKSKRPSRSALYKLERQIGVVFSFFILLITAGLIGFGHYVKASAPAPIINTDNVDPNWQVRTLTKQFFADNGAPEMLPIIRCESNFKQFETDGTVLKNRAGSSAIGVAQIMSSLHPDPKIIYRYNKRFNTDFQKEDFDITTLEGNLGYALILYKIRGVRDWECAKKVWW